MENTKRSKTPFDLYWSRNKRSPHKEILELSKMLHAPILSSALGKGIIPDKAPAYMGAAGRVASKPGVEIAANTDAVLFLGSDMPFQSFFIPKDAKYVQVDIDGTKF